MVRAQTKGYRQTAAYSVSEEDSVKHTAAARRAGGRSYQEQGARALGLPKVGKAKLDSLVPIDHGAIEARGCGFGFAPWWLW